MTLKALLALSLMLAPLALAFPAEAAHTCGAPKDVADTVYFWTSPCLVAYVDSPVGVCTGWIIHEDNLRVALCAVGVWIP